MHEQQKKALENEIDLRWEDVLDRMFNRLTDYAATHDISSDDLLTALSARTCSDVADAFQEW